MTAAEIPTTVRTGGPGPGGPPRAGAVGPSRLRGTSLGILAILFWASTVAFSRVATEAVGHFTTAAVVFVAAGLVSCAWAAATSTFRAMFRHPWRYLLGCGGLFALYTVCLYAAIGLPPDRQVTIEVALVNYLWPAMVLLLSVPISGSRAGWPLLPGVLMALLGTALGAADVHGLTTSSLVEHVRTNATAFAGGLAAAVSWGLYSNLTRRWGSPDAPSAVPIFLLATGALIALLRLGHEEPASWSVPAALSILYLSFFPTVLSCVFWDVSMRTGNFAVVGAAAQLTPLLSTVISCFVLGARPGLLLWAGACLVVAGAIVCRIAMKEVVEERGSA